VIHTERKRNAVNESLLPKVKGFIEEEVAILDAKSRYETDNKYNSFAANELTPAGNTLNTLLPPIQPLDILT
jgi:hypothetical protein